MFINAKKYLETELLKLSASHGLRANIYTRRMREAGVRICNDGYPDARFKETYNKNYEEIRQIIADIRTQYRLELTEYEYKVLVGIIKLNKPKHQWYCCCTECRSKK